jgi:putative nucleotidyltransferase-like protein
VPADAQSRTTTAFNLAVDATTVEVVSALRAADIEPILLKGPGLARLLYEDPAQRPYVDTDLLVAPGDVAGTERVLEGLGFRRNLAEEMTAEWQRHASEWARGRSHVDLHRTLMGARAPDETVWAALSAHARPLSLGPIEVSALDVPATALHTALHAAQHGDRDGKHIRDLRLALERLTPASWEAAAALAAELDAAGALGIGLRLARAGERVAQSLGLPADRDVPQALHAASAPGGALALERLARAHGPRARAALLARAAFPPAQHLRYFHPLARRGRLGLAAVYLARPVDLARKLPGAWRAWRRARSRARAGG